MYRRKHHFPFLSFSILSSIVCTVNSHTQWTSNAKQIAQQTKLRAAIAKNWRENLKERQREKAMFRKVRSENMKTQSLDISRSYFSFCPSFSFYSPSIKFTRHISHPEKVKKNCVYQWRFLRLFLGLLFILPFFLIIYTKHVSQWE